MTNKKKDQTLSDRVYDQLRDELLDGGFVPGRSVTIRGIAADKNVSPMPVREALRRLTAQQALQLTQTGRVKVPEMTRAKLNELVNARICLEKQVAIDAMPFVDDKLIDRLTALNDDIDLMIEKNDSAGYLKAHRMFHFSLYRVSESTVFQSLIESIWLQISPFLSYTISMDHLEKYNTNDRHVEVLDALHARDATALGFAIEADVRHGLGSLTERDWQAMKEK